VKALQRAIGVAAASLLCCSDNIDRLVFVATLDGDEAEVRVHTYWRIGVFGAADVDGDGIDELIGSTPAALGFVRHDGSGRRLAEAGFGAPVAWIPLENVEAQLLTLDDTDTLHDFRCVVEEDPSCSRAGEIDLPARGPFVLGDFLEDGKVDLALLSPTGALMLIAGIGPPIDGDAVADGRRLEFEAARRFEFNFEDRGSYSSLAAADADDDGHIDVLVQADIAVVHFGDGTGAWHGSVAVTPTRDQASGPSRCARMGDGLVHVVVGNELHLNNGDRTFADGLVLATDEHVLLVGDFDPEEGEEVLAASGSGASIVSVTAGSEVISRPIEHPNPGGISWDEIIGDYDGNGRDDLAHGGYASRQGGCSPDDPF
jgi:hypothetical protein